MPATDQTRYEIKHLHRVFAASSIMLLLVTVWMIHADHHRAWKDYQRTADRIDTQMAQWRRRQFLTEDVHNERQQLQRALAAVRATSLSAVLLNRFRAEVELDASRRGVEMPSFGDLDRAVAALRAAAKGGDARRAARLRDQVLSILDDMMSQAEFREQQALHSRKSGQARLDVVKGDYGLAVDRHREEPELAKLRDAASQLTAELEQQDTAYDAAAGYHEALRTIRHELTRDEEALRERLDEMESEQRRLEQAVADKRSTYFESHGGVPVLGKKWLELPFLDAFNSPRQIKNIWADGLQLQLGSFGTVRRFDRCTTCHGAIDQILTGTKDQPGYRTAESNEFVLRLPDERPARLEQGEARHWTPDRVVQEIFGFQLVGHDLQDHDAVTVTWVRPGSPAAAARQAVREGRELAGGAAVQQLFESGGVNFNAGTAGPGLLVGDTIISIDGSKVADHQSGQSWIVQRLLAAAQDYWKSLDAGEEPRPPVRLVIQRGLPHPFASHPRIDLFGGSLSPHKIAKFGCTICHEGQGSATSFKWSAHTPNSPAARSRWHTQHGWFDDRDWPYPMYPRRFTESTCLKCHHDVVELGASAQYPAAPASQVVAGFRLVRKLACFGCHEINGYADNARRIGPDLRLEPNYVAAALQLKGAPDTGYANLTRAEKGWIDQLIADPERDDVRHRILAMIDEDARLATPPTTDTLLASTNAAAEPEEESGVAKPRLATEVHRRLRSVLADQQLPGVLRKAGPSLRFVTHKLDSAFLFDWIRDPARFRSTTLMPRAFGLWKHLPGPTLRRQHAGLIAQMKPLQSSGSSASRQIGALQRQLAAIEKELENTDETERRFEPIEVYSMVTFLLERSQGFEYLASPENVTPIRNAEDSKQQVERGRIAFQQRGCLACHAHNAFPEMERFRSANSINRGPDLSDTGVKFDRNRNPNGARWLYSWVKQPTRYDARTVMPDLTLDPLPQRDENGKIIRVTDPVADIVAFLMSSPSVQWQPADAVIQDLNGAQSEALDALAREYLSATFRRPAVEQYLQQGIPLAMQDEFQGAEKELLVSADEAPRITAKEMAHKRVLYVGAKSFYQHGCFGCHDIPGFEDAKPIGIALTDWGRKDASQLAFAHIVAYVGDAEPDEVSNQVAGQGQAAVAAGGTRPETPPPFYLQQLEAQNRIGFVYQKLTQPRSFDFRVAEFKKYSERLRMPQFSLSVTQREQIATFILGLVANPPTQRLVYHPGGRTKAIQDGELILDKYNCQACHVLEPERWHIDFAPGEFGPQPQQQTFPFVPAHFSHPQQVASAAMDRRNRRNAVVAGMPSIGEDGFPRVLDEEEFPLEADDEDPYALDQLIFPFDLWEPALVDGHVYQVGGIPLLVHGTQIQQREESRGGALTKYLLPRIVRRERQVNFAAKGSEAWGWLPPPLTGEGAKVQPDWLHDYLLNPVFIRPAVGMRMPRFNMSSREATILVNYFAARDDVAYPYEMEPTRLTGTSVSADRAAAQDMSMATGSERRRSPANAMENRFDGAMRIVTDSNYCVKCHIVGDYNPLSSDRAKAPDLVSIQNRLRPRYVRRWLARPSSILPYTSMQVNFTYDRDAPNEGASISQELYRGTSTQQLDAVLDLVMNFNWYLRQRAPISPMVRETLPSASEPPTSERAKGGQ